MCRRRPLRHSAMHRMLAWTSTPTPASTTFWAAPSAAVSGSSSEISPEYDLSPVSQEAGDFLSLLDQEDACSDQERAQALTDQIAGREIFAAHLGEEKRQQDAEG